MFANAQGAVGQYH